MESRRLCQVSFVLVLIIMITSIHTSAESYINLSSDKEAPNKFFEVFFEDGGEWVQIDSIEATKYFKDLTINMPKPALDLETLKVKIRKSGGGLAHIDAASLGPLAPVAILDAEASPLSKVLKVEHDVAPVDESGLELTFNIGDLVQKEGLTLKINGRIENEFIGNWTFAYPKTNQLNPITVASDFYEYKWNQNVGSNILDGNIEEFMDKDLLFKVYNMPASGHPNGYTYGWVRNDDDYLYAVIDFTPDNTVDGEKDFATLNLATASGIKSFKVSESENEWGLASFVYTDNVEYQHKVYEFKIPKSELSLDDDKYLQMTFNAYGTAMPSGPYKPDVAYASTTNQYLIVYQDYDSSSSPMKSAIIGQFFDYSGVPTGAPFEIAPLSSNLPENPEVVYNSVNDEFLVLWNRGISTDRRIEGIVISTSGNDSGASPVLLDTPPNIDESHDNPKAAFSSHENKYVIVWNKTGKSAVEVDGVVIEADLTGPKNLDFWMFTENIKNYDVTYNFAAQTFEMVYEAGPNNHEVIKHAEFTTSGSHNSYDTLISEVGITNQKEPHAVYNSSQNDTYIIWTDSSDGTNKLLGKYKSASGDPIEFSSNVQNGSAKTALASGPITNQMLVAWTEYIEEVPGIGKAYTQMINADGSKATVNPDIMFSEAATLSEFEIVSNKTGKSYLMVFSCQTYGSSQQLVVRPIDYGKLDFADSSVSVTEGDTATLTIQRTSGFDGEVTVDYATSSGSTSASDYTSSSGTITFASGEISKHIVISTTEDEIVEDTETIVVTLSNPTGGVSLGAQTSMEINIIDNDAAPYIINTTPSNNKSNVSVGENIKITFSDNIQERDMSLLTVEGNTVVDYDYNITDSILTIDPKENLDYDSLYKITIGAEAIQDMANNPLESDYTFSFSTGTAPDLSAPYVMDTEPIDNETGVSVNTDISITFSEDIFENKLELLTLKKGNTVVEYVYNIADNTLTIDPKHGLNYGTLYTVKIPSGTVQDAVYNPSNASVFSFTTINNNADLSNIQLSNGNLNTSFAPDILDYEVNVGHEISSITLTPTLKDSKAKVQVNGEPIENNTISNPISLKVGDNKIVLLVTAEDQKTTKVYTIILTRADDDDDKDSGGSNHHSNSNITPNSITSSNTAKQNDQLLKGSLEKTGTAVLSLENFPDNKAKITPDIIQFLTNKEKSFVIENTGIQITFHPNSLNTPQLIKAIENENSYVEIGVKVLTKDKKKKILEEVSTGESTGIFEIGGKIFALTSQVIIKNTDGTTTTEKIDALNEPVTVTMDLSYLTLTDEDSKKLTGVRYETDENGDIHLVKLGGIYDKETKTFTFYTDQFGLYGVGKANELTTFRLTINELTSKVNNETQTNDVAPVIINNRTMVPVRFIAENLGADVNWNAETKTVSIHLDGETLSMAIGHPLENFDTPPTIVNNRTLVPIRYVSEKLGANVLWFPSNKTVSIIK